jgi:hypothetical protein
MSDQIPPPGLIPLGEAAGQIPGRQPGRPLSPNTLHGWRARGVRGVWLRSLLCVGRPMTTRGWLAGFLAGVNQHSEGRVTT